MTLYGTLYYVAFSGNSRNRMVNSKLTATLAGVVAGASGVAAIFEPVVTGTAVSLPLLTGTAGSFTLPLAVLGVLKLAAAASLAGVGVGSAFLGPVKDLVPEVPGLPISSSSAYGSYYHRQRRSIDVGSDEAVFGLVSSLDMYSCGKALVCSLASKPALEEDEALIMSLFA